MVNGLKALAVALILMLLVPGPGAQGPGPCKITGPVNLNFTLKDLNGKDVKLSSYKGDKVLLINFWATWCIPCRTEIPGFIEALVKPYARNIKMNYPVLIEQGHDVHDSFGLVGLPTTIIISRDGTKCEQHVGFTRRSTFEEAVKRLLASS
jgi:thiol-disulfide isomerase/thioredoxin